LLYGIHWFCEIFILLYAMRFLTLWSTFTMHIIWFCGRALSGSVNWWFALQFFIKKNQLDGFCSHVWLSLNFFNRKDVSCSNNTSPAKPEGLSAGAHAAVKQGCSTVNWKIYNACWKSIDSTINVYFFGKGLPIWEFLMWLVALLPHKNTWVNVTAIEVPTVGTGNPCFWQYFFSLILFINAVKFFYAVHRSAYNYAV